ncbi:hypothetical protein [Anaeropeptidivorans aminofermentans]|uniref:hypothetical protein n=1 Tax=Anaeropeptidivorans aminofermentans TaxID=2934315 RepID=UPI0020246EDE|nr:hypothetical protein [Anaeropeptidivorans aminofermentans]MBE6011414.1 hypothetical protein [Lachnospiraceae bacterium]
MSVYIKFIYIVICFLISLMYKNGISKRDLLLLRLALFFTASADYFMLVADNNRAGVYIFILVQLIYIKRYGEINIKKAAVAIAGITLFYKYFLEADILIGGSLIYAFLFLKSMKAAVRACGFDKFPYPNSFFILIGMFLLFICDTSVALYNILYMVWNIDSSSLYFLIWFFYIPSQLLILLSGRNFKAVPKKQNVY